MRIALLGHPGVGKTTWAAQLTCTLAHAGAEVLAVDAARRPSLAQALGLARTPAAGAGLNAPRRGQAAFDTPGTTGQPTSAGDSSVGRYGMRPMAQRSAWAGALEPLSLPSVQLFVLHGEHAAQADGLPCGCPADLRPRLDEALRLSPAPNVVFDFEPGPQPVLSNEVDMADALLVVIEPYFRALETGARLFDLARARNKPCALVANKIRSGSEDEAALAAFVKRRNLPLLTGLPYDDEMSVMLQASRLSRSGLASFAGVALAWCQGLTLAATV